MWVLSFWGQTPDVPIKAKLRGKPCGSEEVLTGHFYMIGFVLASVPAKRHEKKQNRGLNRTPKGK